MVTSFFLLFLCETVRGSFFLCVQNELSKTHKPNSIQHHVQQAPQTRNNNNNQALLFPVVKQETERKHDRWTKKKERGRRDEGELKSRLTLRAGTSKTK